MFADILKLNLRKQEVRSGRQYHDILSVLKKKPRPRKMTGWQEGVMDLDKMRESLDRARQVINS